MKLIATKRQRFSGKELKAGDAFETTNSYGRILIKRKMAKLVVEEIQQEKPKRYNRRDLVAEDHNAS
jgi:hypothetical protein